MLYLVKKDSKLSVDKLVINNFNKLLLKKGQRVNSRRIMFNLLNNLKIDGKVLQQRDSLNFFFEALSNILVRFVIKHRKKGKLKQEIPFVLNKDSATYGTTIRLLVQVLKKGSRNASFHSVLFKELLDASKNQGVLKKKVSELNKVVIKNRKFIV